MTKPDIRNTLSQAVAPFLDQQLYGYVQKILPGMDHQAIRHIFAEVDNCHQRINQLRIDILTLVDAEYERQGLTDENDNENASDEEQGDEQETDESE